jgi:hypothetical protein
MAHSLEGFRLLGFAHWPERRRIVFHPRLKRGLWVVTMHYSSDLRQAEWGSGPFAKQQFLTAHVCYGSKADIRQRGFLAADCIWIWQRALIL